jgi:hypothetical protein
MRVRIGLRRTAGRERALVHRVRAMKLAWSALLLVACSEAHMALPDASICAWRPPPATMIRCSVEETDACIAWAAALAPSAIVRCVLSGRGASQYGGCVSASACDGAGVCTCGAEPPCADGSACMADGSTFVCVACTR